MLDLKIAHSDTGIPDLKEKVDTVLAGNGVYPYIHTALFGVFETVAYQMEQDLADLLTVTAKLCGNGRIEVDDEIEVILIHMGKLGKKVVNNRVYHVRLIAYGKPVHIDLGKIQNVTDLFGNPVTCI